MHEIVVITAKYFVAIPVLIYLYVLWRATSQERLKLLIATIACATLTFFFMKLAASLYHDPRPFVSDHVTPYFQHGTDNGFPSDHTTFSALLAWLVFSRNRALGIALLALALLIGTSRVIAGIHHGKDILGGFAIATLGYWLGTLLVQLVSRLRQQNKAAAD
jgi:undecaprenyl-diphosphatase